MHEAWPQVIIERMSEANNFIEEIIESHNESGRFEKRVKTRFPPEPNGYLHIGHAKAICLNFEIAKKYGGTTNLRFDDTNPVKEDTEFVNSIMEDVSWLGFQWSGEPHYASDYFDQLFDYAVELIKTGKAYIDDSSSEEIRAMKGTPTQAGTNSPYRDRTVEENLALFEGMRDGDFEDGAKVLRAKIDMSSSNMHMRDPVIYRIKKVAHHRTGNKWNIYPMYDFAHGYSDSIEKITHSLCTLEFEVHRPLYDWLIDQVKVYHPQQIEFSRLNVNYLVTSKRKLRRLVEDGLVSGWDDPRMPTISGMRRRGFTPEALKNFVMGVGITKFNAQTDIALLENAVRKHLNEITDRMMVVLDPIKLVITNYPEGKIEEMDVVNNPQVEEKTTRKVPFSRTVYIERTDFMENPPTKYFRLFPGGKVRLKNAYIVEYADIVKDAEGNILEIHCTHLPESKSGSDTSGIKVKGTIHWVSADDHIEGEVRIYDRLFSVPNPDGDEEKDFMEFLNPDSLKVIPAAKMERNLAVAKEGEKFQFLRNGYFSVDKDSTSEKLVFNRAISLRDSWSKAQKKQE